jgi:hypothetical protein
MHLNRCTQWDHSPVGAPPRAEPLLSKPSGTEASRHGPSHPYVSIQHLQTHLRRAEHGEESEAAKQTQKKL